MSGIDWSKAPADAGYAREHCDGLDFYKRTAEGKWVYWDCSGQWSRAYGTREADCIARPAWDGEGLPPAGTDCELKFGHWNDWERCTVLYVGEKMVFVRQITRSSETFEGAMNREGVMFRPIRTAEQIAAEERKATVEQMCLTSMGQSGPPICIAAAESLYDAGYRKQVQP